MKKLISIITPTYNEKENVIKCINSIEDFFKRKNYNYEHIICDNSSSDNTVKLDKQKIKKNKNIKLIVNARNYGIMPSLFNALKFTKGQAILTCYACDMQDPIEYLKNFIKNWEIGYDTVYAIRKKREEFLLLKFIKLFYYKIYNLLSDGIKKDNFVNVFQLIDKRVKERIIDSNPPYPYIASLININSSNSIGVETFWKKRMYGKAKNNLYSLSKEAIITLTQFTIFQPFLALISLIFLLLFFLSLLILLIFKYFYAFDFVNIFMFIGISSIFLIALIMINIFILSIKMYYSNVSSNSKNKVMVKELINIK